MALGLSIRRSVSWQAFHALARRSSSHPLKRPTASFMNEMVKKSCEIMTASTTRSVSW